MAYHSLFPSYLKYQKKNTVYVPWAWFRSQRCIGKGSSLTCDGEVIRSGNHVLGITDQCGHKIIFTCNQNALKKKHSQGVVDFPTKGINSIITSWYKPSEEDLKNHRILPYCPSCGEKPPEEFLKKLRGKK